MGGAVVGVSTQPVSLLPGNPTRPLAGIAGNGAVRVAEDLADGACDVSGAYALRMYLPQATAGDPPTITR
jgi:hypothetical protein